MSNSNVIYTTYYIEHVRFDIVYFSGAKQQFCSKQFPTNMCNNQYAIASLSQPPTLSRLQGIVIQTISICSNKEIKSSFDDAGW